MSEVVLNLKKKFELNLTKAGILNVPVLQAKAAIDKSGSMSQLFSNGWVSNTLDLFLGAALKFDDNGELEVGFFDTGFESAPVAIAADGGQYMNTKGREFNAGGGTCFAPIIENFGTRPEEAQKTISVFGRLFGKKEAPKPGAPTLRSYVGIITDGDNSDKPALERALEQTDGTTFYQFIGIGNGVDPSYLPKLSQRYKHVSFVHIKDPSKMTPDSFYEALCNPQFAAWI